MRASQRFSVAVNVAMRPRSPLFVIVVVALAVGSCAHPPSARDGTRAVTTPDAEARPRPQPNAAGKRIAKVSELELEIVVHEISCAKAEFTVVIDNPGAARTLSSPSFRLRSEGQPTRSLDIQWDGAITPGRWRRRFATEYIPGRINPGGARIVLSLTDDKGVPFAVGSPATPSRRDLQMPCLRELKSYAPAIPNHRRIDLPGRWRVSVIQREGLVDDRVTSQYSYLVRVGNDGSLHRLHRRQKADGTVVNEETKKDQGWINQVGESDVAMKWPPEDPAVFLVRDRGPDQFTLSLRWTIEAPSRAEWADMPNPRAPRRDRHFITEYRFQRDP